MTRIGILTKWIRSMYLIF